MAQATCWRRQRGAVGCAVQVVAACCVVASGFTGTWRMAARSLSRRDAAPALQDGRVAVLLSLNARGVSRRAVEAARSCVPAEDVFATSSLEEARVAADVIVARGYGTVVSAGGDGTLSAAVSMICRARAACGEPRPLEDMPRFVALPLGTGNAVARYVLGPCVV